MTDSNDQRRRRLQHDVSLLVMQPLMRGSLVQRLRKCGRPTCACATDPAARHGGLFLTVHLNGRTQAMHVRPEDEPAIRQAIDTYSKLWDAINALTSCELAALKSRSRERQRARKRRQD